MFPPLRPTPPASLLTLLVCGFGGFPGFPDNPAARVVDELSRQGWAPPGAHVAYLELPTTWGGAVRTIAAALADADADAVLVIGVAGDADGFRVETHGRNRARTDAPDAAGAHHPHDRIADRGPAAAQTTAPTEAMAQAIRALGLPAEVSCDAGDYLCNYTYYRLLTEAGRPAAFLHIPPTLALPDLVRAARAAAAVLVSSLTRPDLKELPCTQA